MSLKETSKLILKKCMGLEEGETCLVVTDKNKLKIANSLFDAAKEISKNIEIMEIPVGKVNSEEQPEYVKEKMKKFDVILIPTTSSLSHTEARKEASEAGARIASMPGITEEIMLRAINVDYDKIVKKGKKIKKIMENGNKVKVLTEKGTNIKFTVKGRKIDIDKGIYNEKSKWGNLPAGEVAFAPLENDANGVFFVDASIGGIGKIDKIVRVTVKDGYAVKIEGGEAAEKLKETIKELGKEARNIAELGIGLNEKAKITGAVLEDEKVLGTAHIAIGDNFSLGGNIKAGCHIDGVFLRPTIFVDEKKIIEKGKLLV